MSVLIEPIETTRSVVKCEGGGLPLGHPRVFLNLGHEGKIICPYCSQSFVKIHIVNKNAEKKKGKVNEIKK